MFTSLRKFTYRVVVDCDPANLPAAHPDHLPGEPVPGCWDKIVILHGLRCWFDARGELRGGNQRDSHHYYDLYQLS